MRQRTRHAAESAQAPAPPAAGTAGLVLAAGGGRRLGGRPKALLTHHGRPLVEHAVRVLREGGCAGGVHVVLGAASADVRARADLTGCAVVDNPGWESGMGSSLRAGLHALAASRATAVVVALVDMPGIGPEAVARLCALSGPEVLAAATYDGRRGHPVLLGRAHWRGVAALARGDAGARDYLRAHADGLTLVECGDVADPGDVDVPADLDRLRP